MKGSINNNQEIYPDYIHDEINPNSDKINKENDINLINSNSQNNNYDNNNNNTFSFKQVSNNSKVEICMISFNPSHFSFKPKSKESLSINSFNNNNSLEQQYITPQKGDDGSPFEKMLTVQKLRWALSPHVFQENKNDDFFHFKTDAKHFPKYPEFKKVTFDDLPELEIMILDDVDKKTFKIYEKANFPPIEEIAEIMKSKNINEEDCDFFSSISYLLFIKRKEFSPEQRFLFLKNIPFSLLNDYFMNSQCYDNYFCDISSSPSPHSSYANRPKNDKSINTICMILNIILFCIQSGEDIKMFFDIFQKNEVYVFIDNLCNLLQMTNNFRLQRKILGLMTNFFNYNDEIILNFFRKVERIIDNNNLSSNMIIKLQQIMKNKQKKYIDLIVQNKNEIEAKIKNKDIEHICYIIRFLKFILSGTQGNFIFDEKDYVSLLKFFKDLEITNQKISEYIYELKLRIKRLL